MEGTVASVPPQGGRKHPQQEFIQIDTTNVLFIVAGAFAGLEEIISNRSGKRGIGFGHEIKAHGIDPDIFNDVQSEDLRKFGLIPEFIGRLPVIATVEPLDRAALMDILTVPKNALTKQYQRMFELDGFELEFDAKALELMADMAIDHETGARGLRAILENTLGPIMFEIPTMETQGTVKITKDVVLGKKEAEITPFKKQQEKSA